MKRTIFFFIAVILLNQLQAQNVGIGTTTPNSNAMLEVSSNTKGLLIPRTSTATRITIPAVKGLLVYDTTTSSFWYNDGVNWMETLNGNNGWALNGNINTNPLVHFIGTTDNQPIRFRLNNQWAGSIDSASGNTLLGYGAGKTVTTGRSNTAFGVKALNNITTGDFNTAVGSGALGNNTSQSDNTAIGYNTLFSNNFGIHNTAISSEALYSNTTGFSNTAIGFNAMRFNTSGSDNTAIGEQAMRSNTTGLNNTAYGVQALWSNTSGQSNTAVGKEALYANTTAAGNTAIGVHALYVSNTGANNTAVGYFAGSSSSGSNNTFIGFNSGISNTTGSSNVALGYGAQTGTNLTNAIAIGTNASVTQSNSLVLGGTGPNAVNVGIGTTAPVYKLSVDGTIGVYAGGNFRGYISSINNDLLINANRAPNIVTNPDNIIMQLTTGSGITLQRAGNVGIGIDSPVHKLHILGGQAIERDGNPYLLFTVNNAEKGFVDASVNDVRIGTSNDNGTGKFIIRTGNTNRFWVDNSGNVSVGNTFKITNGFLLNVQGKMICEEVKVQLAANWPDYVFDKNYSLLSFDELRNYISQHNHLPNMPVAAEVESSGLSLGDMQRRMMEKIEELTLYVLQLEQQNKKQDEEIKALKKQDQ